MITSGRLLITITCAIAVAHSKPIAVSFGTKGGPIVPPTPSTSTVNPLAPRNPAPVYEAVDDVPPPVYKPPKPNQYRDEINALGTPLDVAQQQQQGGLNSLAQIELRKQKAEYARRQGLSYSGAQLFDVQEYEFDNARKSRQQQSSVQQFVQQYVPKQGVDGKPNVRHQRHPESVEVVPGARFTRVYTPTESQTRQPARIYNQQVPLFGVVFSSGRRYYIPQFYYYDSRQQQQQQQQQQHQQQQHVPLNYRQSQNANNELTGNAIYEHPTS